jgi:hypothetical protein
MSSGRKYYIEDKPANQGRSDVFCHEGEQPEGWILIDATNPLIDKLIERTYNQYELDGLAYFKETRIQFVKCRMLAVMTSTNIIDIEQKLKDVESNIKSGNWKSAELILVRDITPDLIVSQAFYDKVLNDIQTYVLNKY